MKAFAKTSGALFVTLALTLGLSACSAPSAAEDTYVPPGYELNGEIVAPPAPLPAALEQPPVQIDAEDLGVCSELTPLRDDVVLAMNKPESSVERKSAALNGEVVVKAVEMPVQTAYQTKFAWLTKADLDNGKSVWFGSQLSLNDNENIGKIVLHPSGEAPLFGATADTYSSFIWGSKFGPGSALVAEGEKVVARYQHCY